MFRYFENLVDPYGPYPQTDTPPRKLLPFLLTYAQPFRRVFWAAGLMSLVVAAVEAEKIRGRLSHHLRRLPGGELEPGHETPESDVCNRLRPTMKHPKVMYVTGSARP